MFHDAPALNTGNTQTRDNFEPDPHVQKSFIPTLNFPTPHEFSPETFTPSHVNN
jgi:hypothetical protein